MYHKALVAVDDSPESFAAAQHSLDMLKENSIDQITLLTVVREPLRLEEHPWPNEWVGPGGFIDTDEVDPETEQYALNRLQPIKQYLDIIGAKVDTLVRMGNPAKVISQVANEGHYDLLVIGSRGLNLLEGAFMDSISQRVMSNVRCPVLMLNPYAAGLKDIEEAQETPSYYEF